MAQDKIISVETREQIARHVARGKELRAEAIRKEAAAFFQWVASLWPPKGSRRILPQKT